MTISLLLGLLIGLVMGLTGAGGGILAVPLLIFSFHLPVNTVAPVALLAMGAACTVGALLGLRAHIVRYRAALLIAAAGIAAAPGGVWMSHRIDTQWLTLLFAGVLILVAYRSLTSELVRRDTNTTVCMRNTADGRFVWEPRCAALFTAVGILTGVLSGLLGVGGGFVIVPALRRYTDLSMQSVIATSLAVIAPISFAGALTSIWGGHFDYALGMPFALGATVGVVLGTQYARKHSGTNLQRGFAYVCLLVSVGLIVKVLG